MSGEKSVCKLCGEPMPAGEEMFKLHGYSGPCPKPPSPAPAASESAEREAVSAARARLYHWAGQLDAPVEELRAIEDLLSVIDKTRLAPCAESIYEQIKHGDDEHRAWLKEALANVFAGKPVPPPSTAPTSSEPVAWHECVTLLADEIRFMAKHAASYGTPCASEIVAKTELLQEIVTRHAPPPIPAGWQPIETAPRDGSELLMTRCTQADGAICFGVATWDDQPQNPAHHWWECPDGPHHADTFWTHWMPMPAAPDLQK